MVTGEKAFQGKSQASLIGAIMESDPPALSSLQPMTPLPLGRVVESCLEKDPEDRWQGASDLRRQLQWILAESGHPDMRQAEPSGMRRLVPWGIAALTSGLAVVLLWSQITTRPAQSVTRLTVTLPEDQRLTGEPETASIPFALSPDGSRLVYSAGRDEQTQLYVRDMDGFEERPIAGTEGATSPFFSPDNAWVGFFADGKFQKVSLAGGAPITICEAPNYMGNGVHWGANERIIFGGRAGGVGLSQVPAGGGRAEKLTTPDVERGEFAHTWPQFLPDGKSVLFTLWGGDDQGTQILSLETGEWGEILSGVLAEGAKFLPTGHLIYVRELGSDRYGRLEAVPFDLARLETVGSPIPVVDGVDASFRAGWASLSVSNTGSLVYLPARPAERSLVWVDHQGGATLAIEDRAAFELPRLSPDGSRVALGLNNQIWVYDIERGTRTRLTQESFNGSPVWTPDGARIVFNSMRSGPWNVYSKPVDGSSEAEKLLASKHPQLPCSWSPNGQVLAFRKTNPDTGSDIGMLSREGEASPFVATTSEEGAPIFSPDGRFLAYVSDESGRAEVYVQPYPATGKKLAVSVNGGLEPLWFADGHELFYRDENQVMAVDIDTSGELEVGKPRPLFEGPSTHGFLNRRNWDISPDGKRFLIIRDESKPPRELRVVLNWFEELKRIVPE